MEVVGFALADAVLRAHGAAERGDALEDPGLEGGPERLPVAGEVADVEVEVRVADVAVARDVDLLPVREARGREAVAALVDEAVEVRVG